MFAPPIPKTLCIKGAYTSESEHFNGKLGKGKE